jgi:hypothetical protein
MHPAGSPAYHGHFPLPFHDAPDFEPCDPVHASIHEDRLHHTGDHSNIRLQGCVRQVEPLCGNRDAAPRGWRLVLKDRPPQFSFSTSVRFDRFPVSEQGVQMAKLSERLRVNDVDAG